MKDVSRRDFLKYIGAGALGLVAGPKLLPALGRGLFPLTDASDVVQCFHEQATSGSTINEPVVQMMVDESIMALTGIRNVGAAWKTIFPGITDASVIGIKVNSYSQPLPTHPAVVRCICNGLAQMDVGSLFKRNNIIVWDRADAELPGRGYTIYDGSDPDTVRCFGTSHSGVGYNTGTPLNVNGVTSNPSRIISGMCNYLISAAVLKTAGTAFVSLGMKNHYGSIDNPGSLHGGQLNPYLPALVQQIRDVIVPNNIQRLCIIDGLFGLYTGGPSGPPNFNPKLLLVSKDPVACDAQGQNVINVERALHSLAPMDSAYIKTAAQPPYSLGTTDINLIELNNIGIQEPARPAPGDGPFDVTPDPVRDRAIVTFAVSRQGPVSLELVNAAGRTEARLFAGTLRRGTHKVNWRAGRRLPAGAYFLRLNNAGATRVRKVMVVR